MKILERSKFSVIATTIFWLLPLPGMPLAFARLTGEKVPLFGMVKFFDFTTLGIIATAMLVLRARSLYNLLQRDRLLRFTALSGVLILLSTLIQQWLYGGSIEHPGIALFYAAVPLSAAAYAKELRKSLPFAATIGAILLLWSGISSEHFTGITGNWNWTQGLLFALLPAAMTLFDRKNFVRNTVIAAAVAIGSGTLFYPEIVSRSILIALPLLGIGMWLWFKFPREIRKYGTPLLFIIIAAIPVLLGIFCNISDSRIYLYRATVEMLKDHCVIGVGMERFFDFIPEYIAPEYFLAPFSAPHHPHPHNELLNITSAFGIAGLFYIGILFCGMLYKFPRRRFTPGKLLPFWIFFFIFLCAQTDLTGAILPGAFWMLMCAGVSFAPPVTEKIEPVPVWSKIIAAVLILTAFYRAGENFRATVLLRQGRLAAIKNDAANALKFYQSSSRIKPTKEALYGKAEIYLHAQNNYTASLEELEKLHSVLGFDNYLHTNRMKAVALVNIGQKDTALPFIAKDAELYPYSIISSRLHLTLLQLLRRPANEITAAQNRFLKICRLRGITPEQAVKFTMSEDDAPLPSVTGKQKGLSYPELFPGTLQEIIAAVFLIAAALGSGALICRSRKPLIVELACGIAALSVCGAVIPAEYAPCLLIVLAPAGFIRNYPKLLKHPMECVIFGILILLTLGSALLPPNSWDEQVYQISLLKEYSKYGFFHQIADNPYSAYPSLCHAFLLTAFDWGGATLPRLTTLLLYGLTGSFLLSKVRRYGTLCAVAVFAAFLLSPLNLLLLRNFYAEPFILIFSIAGTILLLGRKLTGQDMFLAGIMAGGAAAVKLTGLGISIGLLVLLLFRSFKLKSLLLFGGGAVSAALLFYLRSWILWGNPFYPYGSRLFGAPESACLVEKFHTLLGGHYGLDPLYGTLFGWLFTALKPELYDGVDCGLQFPLFFAAAFCGVYLAVKRCPKLKWHFAGTAAALLATYIFWGLTARQSRFLLPVFFGAALLTLLTSAHWKVLWKKVVFTAAIAAAVISLMKQSNQLMHFYYSWRVLSHARRSPAGFSALDDNDYAKLLYLIDQLPPEAEIALLTERRTLYMPRKTTLLMPHFQEKFSPVPDDENKLLAEYKKFDYIITRLPVSDVDRAPEYDAELTKLYTLTGKLVNQGKLFPLPGSQMMILRTGPSAAGNAFASNSANSASVESADAVLRKEDGKPRPLR